MKILSGLKLYKKWLAGITLVVLAGAITFCAGAEGQDDNKEFLFISEMEIALLQCRRAEKNFLIRHDRKSVDSFARGVRTLKKSEANLRTVARQKTVLRLLKDVSAQVTIYNNTFQDIKGLYDSVTFGPAHDPALSGITDEITLMSEPNLTPSSVNTINSLVEAGRNLEYFIQLGPKSFQGLAATLNLRRWEKNFQKSFDKKSYNKSKSSSDSMVIFYKRKVYEEISKLRALTTAENIKDKEPALTEQTNSALKHYESNFNQLVANQDAFYMKKTQLVKTARSIENNIRMIKGALNPEKSKIPVLISDMEIALLQCRRAEKNFFLRKDQASVDCFEQDVRVLRKYERELRPETRDKAILNLLDDINIELNVYENAFQDIKGLCDSTTFGPVHDPALSKITDQVTLMSIPDVTPSSVRTTDSLIEAARNLEYFIGISSENSGPLISILQARRWEKNFEKRYDRLTGEIDSESVLYIKNARQEISKIREWLKSMTPNIKSEAFAGRLNSALERYERNLLQLSRNLDTFYIKQKEVLRSTGTIDRTIQMIKEKLFGNTVETEIDGLYYLSSRMPIHGQPLGNYHDVGSLAVNPPAGYGYRHCKNWMQFYFDRNGHYTKENFISSIYFHIWIRTVNNSIDVGYEKEGKYSGGRGGMDDFRTIDYDDSKGYSTNNGCSLITGKIKPNCSIKEENIYKFALKLSRYSGYPSIAMEPAQQSFIIINPPGNSVLKSTDSDNDGLNDYEEMFTYFTNPRDFDTDGDGLSDRTEILKGTAPNINDFYLGGVIPGINATPHIEQYKIIDGDWSVDKEERYVDTKFTLRGNLFVRNGGLLILNNCILNMNSGAKNKRIHVDKGGTLIVSNSEINFNETGYWYKIVQGSKVETDCDFDVYGTVNLDKSVLKNSFGIKVNKGSKSNINKSRLLNCYHLSYDGKSDSKIDRSHISTFIGIPIYCKSSSPIIRDSVLSVEYTGVGLYCLSSSPSIYNSEIFVCEDEDSDSSALVVLAGSHPVVSNTRFNTNRTKQDATSSVIFE